MDGPPPPPPPHGENPQSTAGGGPGTRGGLPDGNYDIFIVPPQSAGGGFIYFPSLQPQRNSFIAGCVFTLVVLGTWWVITPVLKEWFSLIIASGGAGVALLMVIVAGGAWGLGRVTFDTGKGPASGSGPAPGAGSKPDAQGQKGPNFNAGGSYAHSNAGAGGFHRGPGPDVPPQSDNYHQHHQSRQSSYNFQGGQSSPPPPPKPEPAEPSPDPRNESTKESAKSAWEKAREETRKREEERRKMEELRRKADELRRQREEAEREKQKQREKEAREKEIRERRERLAKEREERIQKEKEAKEKEEQEKEKERILREAREKEAKEKADREARLAKLRAEREARLQEQRAKEERLKEELAKEQRTRAASSTTSSPSKTNFKQASAKTEADHETLYSYRPYDKPKSPKKAPTAYTSSHSSFAASSYAASESTARTTPPPSHRNGPYSTKDPEKIVIKAVYAFNSALGKVPLATLQSGIPPVSEGLVLRISTEGMFIDDDVRGVPQREWDVKAWTLKTVETGQYRGMHILRASLRDSENKKYVFIFGSDENWKADQGVSRLRKSPQVRALGVSAMGLNEAKNVLEVTGWV